METSDRSSPTETEITEDDNLLLENIMKMKQQRVRILHEFNNEHENEILPLMKEFERNVNKKEEIVKSRRKSDVPTRTPTRRSKRISTKIDDFQSTFYQSPPIFVERPPNDYGPMPGIEVGHHWETRMECSYDGVHRPTVAGIHAGPMGAFSIALSGGYPEDVDEGHTFTYTGAGGRDLKGTAKKPKNLRLAPQTKDQELDGVNYSLVRSIETGKPVRVIRGYKSNSIFAPESGYRYDGLYKAVEYWEDFGKTGFRIYRFKMVRMENQAPPPWENPTKRSGRYYRSEVDENKNPNEKCAEDFSELNDKNEFVIINTIESKNEVELDDDIKKCNERLCQYSVNPSTFCERSKNKPQESSFIGWD